YSDGARPLREWWDRRCDPSRGSSRNGSRHAISETFPKRTLSGRGDLMAQLVRIASGTPWEPVAAYSRAVKAGEFVAVSGTTATDERGLVVGGGQMYVQARQALTNIRTALERMGLSMQDVVRTRMFVTDISRFAEVARAHHDFFVQAPPASTMVEVKALVHPA